MACFRSTLNGHRQIANHEQRTCEFFRRIIAENVLCVYVCAREKWKLKGHAKINRSRMAWHTACVTKNERNEKKKISFFFYRTRETRSENRNENWENQHWSRNWLTYALFCLFVNFFLYIYRIEKIDWTFFCSLFHCPRTTLTPCLALSFFHSVDVIVFDFAVFLWNLLMLIFVRRFLTQVYCLQTTISNLTNRV